VRPGTELNRQEFYATPTAGARQQIFHVPGRFIGWRIRLTGLS